MSTLVGDLIEEIQDRVPEDKVQLLFPFLNRAIDLVSERLYLMESDLIIGDLSIDVFAQDTYSASTIAFVEGGLGAADTITDSANGLVTAGFAADMPILSNCPGNAGPFRIASVAAGVITLNTEESLIAQAAGSAYTITSLATFGYLPDDFNGLVGKINIDGELRTLAPLPSRAVELQYSGAGHPLYYKLRGNRLYVIPGTATDIEVVGEYYKKPALVVRMDQYIPFFGTMDSAIQECLVRVIAAGATSITPEVSADMETFLSKKIDLYAPKRQQKAPVKMPGGIDWDG